MYLPKHTNEISCASSTAASCRIQRRRPRAFIPSIKVSMATNSPQSDRNRHVSHPEYADPTTSCPARAKIVPSVPPIKPEPRIPTRIPLYLAFRYLLLLSGPPTSAVLRGNDHLVPRSLTLRFPAARSEEHTSELQ